ncbi:MAG: BlaI/MecI/CopY family transcriptional regulator [Verrucomicrobiota bacterium]
MNLDFQLSKRERQIMEILLSQPSATAADIRFLMPEAPSDSAVRTHLRILVEKGYAQHRKEGNKFVYSAKVSKNKARKSALQRILTTFFGGSVDTAVTALLDVSDTQLSKAEINQIQGIIDKAKKRGK